MKGLVSILFLPPVFLTPWGQEAWAATAADSPAAPTAVIAAGQDDDEEQPQDKRELIKERIAALNKHIKKKKGEEDLQAIAVIDELVQEFERSGPKDRGAIVKALGGCFKVKRREIEEGIPDDRLFQAAAVALGQMGPVSTKTLIAWIDHKKLRDNVNLQRRLILSLGKTRDPEGISTLLKLLDHKEAALIGASAEALGMYEAEELDERKEIFNELLKVLMAAKGRVDRNTSDPVARDRYDAVVGPILTSLRGLSGQDAGGPEDWQRWWNKNKKADWDAAG